MRLTDVFSTVRGVSVALGLLCAAASLAADGPGLVDAAKNGDANAVRSLLKSGADPNQAAPDGSTAVHWAVHGDNLAMLNALLDAGAKPDAVTRYRIAPADAGRAERQRGARRAAAGCGAPIPIRRQKKDRQRS
jgi:hypothetical protein